MATSISSPQTPVHKIKRKPAPTLLSPITPITPLRTPTVDYAESPTKAVQNDVSKHDTQKPYAQSISSSSSHSRVPSASLLLDPRYPPPDPSDPFAPLSVLRDRNQRRSPDALSSASSDLDIGGKTSASEWTISEAAKFSYIPAKAARTLGVFKDSKDSTSEVTTEKKTRKRTSICSFELYPDPPLSRDENLMLGKNSTLKKSASPRSTTRSSRSKPTTPTKPLSGYSVGHYTPHSRQRVQSSFSALSSPSSASLNTNPPIGKLHVLIPAPESYPPPSLVRDRSESSVSAGSSNGGGSHSGNTSDSTTLNTPGSNGSQVDFSEPYAVAMALLSSKQVHPFTNPEVCARAISRDPSPSRHEYGHSADIHSTPKSSGKKDKAAAERSMSPAGSMFRLTRFFTGGKSSSGNKSPTGGSLRNESKTTMKQPSSASASPKSKNSPSRGRERTRKLSTSSISISGPVSTPVSVPFGQELPKPTISTLTTTKPVTRPRSQTTSGIPLSTTVLSVSTPYSSHGADVPAVSASAVGLRTTDFGAIAMSDEEVEAEITKDISRLKPWTASIPRKRSSLSLSILPSFSELGLPSEPSSNGTCETEGSTSSNTEDGVADGSLAIRDTAVKGKRSRESCISAGSMGSSYINVNRSGEGVEGKGFKAGEGTAEYMWPKQPPLTPRSKSGTHKSNGIAGIRFPGFRKASAPSMVSSGGSIRGLKISNPMLQNVPNALVASEQSPSSIPPSPTTSTLKPSTAQNHSVKGHERAISESGVTALERSQPVLEASPTEAQDDEITSDTRLPSSTEIESLLVLPLFDENGRKVAFGDVLNTSGGQGSTTVIVLFIRHFWCPLDQDYIQEVSDLLSRLSEGSEKWKLATEEGELRIGTKDLPEVVIISNGSPALISKYKEIFDLGEHRGTKFKVKMYTDPTCQTYGVLGMGNVGEACVNATPSTPSITHTDSSPPESPRGRHSGSKYEAGLPLARTDHRTPPRNIGHRKSRSLAPSTSLFSPSSNNLTILRSRSRSPSPASRPPVDDLAPRSLSPTPSTSSTQGSYVKHASVIGGIATVVMRAIKVGMPVWEKGGAIKQLGGEVAFNVVKDQSDLQVECLYAHRMQNAQDHTPFGDVLKVALTAVPSNTFVTFHASPSASASEIPHSTSHSQKRYSSLTQLAPPPYDWSVSAPLHHFPVIHPLQQTAFSEPTTPVDSTHPRSHLGEITAQTTNGLERSPLLERVRTISESELNPRKDRLPWGDQLHAIRTQMAAENQDTSIDSIRGIRSKDSFRSSGTASSIRAMRAIRTPRGPRMRMQSVSADSLSGLARSRSSRDSIAHSGTLGTLRSFGSSGMGMEGIESVLEYGDSISMSSPDLNASLLANTSARSQAEQRWRSRYFAMESTSTLNSSVYFDANEGLVLDPDNSRDEAGEESTDEEEELRSSNGVEVDVVPVESDSRSVSRLRDVECSVVEGEAQDHAQEEWEHNQTFDSAQSAYSTTSATEADRTEQLTSICSSFSDDEDDVGDYSADQLRELLVVRASNLVRGRAI